ncbi:CPBP family intramembrane glutamic endopeptidase [Sphingomicrobium sp. XHP0239]|uniref:CPBP family intramembrane glutamic endopeptidase n=1 Tax=Sphingomicrobium maritimum TaxID=3133972 RepID=UPI0031CC6107
MNEPTVSGTREPHASRARRFPPFVPTFLTTPRRPVVAVIGAWLLCILGSLMIAAIVRALLPQGEAPDFSALQALGPATILFSLVIFAPVVETLIMGGVLLVLLQFMRPGYAVIVSAAGWAVAHSMQAAIWGLVIWWPFLIFSLLFVVWRERSLVLAFLLPAVTHMLQNSLPALAVAFPELAGTA